MSTPTIKPVILKHRGKPDGSFNVKLRITHQRKVKYIPTTFTVKKGEYDKSFELKSSAIVWMSDFLKQVNEVISSKNTFEWETMSIDQVAYYIEESLKPEEKFELDFFEFGEIVASKKPKYSAANYRSALNSFASFLGRSDLDISMITSTLMRAYESHLVDKHGKDARALSLYISAIAYIHSEARKKYNDNELDKIRIKNPFEYYKPPKQKPAKKFALPPEVIQKLIDIRHDLKGLHKLAVDTFLLSFITMGSNVPDLYYAEIEGDVILYYRTKTKERRHDDAEMQIRLEPVCAPLINDMKDSSGEKAFKLHRLYTFYKSIADKGNDRLKEVAEMIGAKPFTMKWARHTWASVAFSIGIPKSLINDCLCHVDPDLAVTDIYITKDWSVLWEANRKVMEQFDWK